MRAPILLLRCWYNTNNNHNWKGGFQWNWDPSFPWVPCRIPACIDVWQNKGLISVGATVGFLCSNTICCQHTLCVCLVKHMYIEYDNENLKQKSVPAIKCCLPFIFFWLYAESVFTITLAALYISVGKIKHMSVYTHIITEYLQFKFYIKNPAVEGSYPNLLRVIGRILAVLLNSSPRSIHHGCFDHLLLSVSLFFAFQYKAQVLQSW